MPSVDELIQQAEGSSQSQSSPKVSSADDLIKQVESQGQKQSFLPNSPEQIQAEKGSGLPQDLLKGAGRTPPPLSTGEKFSKYAQNIPGDLGDLAKGLYNVARHPIDTFEGMSDVGAGLALRAIPESWQKEDTLSWKNEDALKERKRLFEASEPVATGAKNLFNKPGETITKAIVDHPVQAALTMMGAPGFKSSATTAHGAMFGDTLEATPKLSRSENIKTAAKREGVDTTLGEETGSPFWQKTEKFNAGMPWIFGTTKYNAERMKQVDNAAYNAIGRYIYDKDKPTFWGNKEYIDSVYQDVKDDAAKINVKISATDTLGNARELKQNYPDIFESIQDSRVKKILNDIIDTTDTPKPEKGKLPVTPTFSFEDLWMLRKGLTDERMNAYAQGKTTAGREFTKALDGVDKDIDALSNISGVAVNQKLKLANEAYKRYNVKFQILQDAYDKALGKSVAGGGITLEDMESFDPNKFKTAIRNALNTAKKEKSGLFKPEEVEQLSGLANLLHVVQAKTKGGGMGYIRDFLMTGGAGWEIGRMMTGGSMTGEIAGGAAGLIGYSLIMKFITTTTAGKSIAMAASKLSPRSPMMKKLTDKLERAMPSYLATQAKGGMKDDIPDITQSAHAEENPEQPQPKVGLGTPGDVRSVPLIVLTKERDKAIADEDYEKAEKLEAKIAKIRATSK
jgi:hypothetical protein